MKKILYNISNDYKDFKIVKDFVIYYDNDNDIVIVNDIKDRHYDLKKSIVFNNTIVFKDNDIDFVFDFDFDFKVIYDNDNDNDNDNDFKYVNDIKIVNDNDINNIVNLINDNDFVKVLIDNDKVFDKDFDKDNKDFVLLSLNKDIYYKIEYQLRQYIRLSYIVFDFDSDNVKVIIKSNNLNYFLDNLNYIYKDLKLFKTNDFLKERLNKKQSLFNQFKYLYLNRLNDKVFDIASKKKKDKDLKHYVNKGINLNKQIDSLKTKLLNNFIKCHLSIYKQYIINNNCYYNDLNDLKDIVFKSFKNSLLDKDFKDKVFNIDKDNVNNDYKYKVNDNDNDNDFDFDFDIDNDFDFNITYSYDNDLFKDFVNDYRKNINKVLKDISYNLSDNKITFKNIINDIDFDIIDFKEKIIKNNDNDLLEKQINFLSQLKDFLIDFEYNKSYDNDNDSYFDNDNDLYHFDIFKSDMNKHNSIIKNISQSDFYHIAYNEKLNDFITID